MGLFNEPPTPESSYPNIPVANFESAGQQLSKGLVNGNWWDDLVAKWRHSSWDGALGTISMLAGGLDDLFAVVVRIFTAFQGLDQPGFFSLVAAMISDFLGVEFSADAMRDAFIKRGRIGAMEEVGGGVFDMLQYEFTGQNTTADLKYLVKPAKAWLGFLIETAIRQGNVDVIANFLPIEINVLKGFEGYGEMISRNLGLGRLARRAFAPLFTTLVGLPLGRALNAQYLPEMLTAAQLVKLYKKGAITEDYFRGEMRLHGWNVERQDLLVGEEDYHWHARELMELVRLGEIDELEAVVRLTSDTIDDDTAASLWKAYTGEATQNLQRQYITELYREVREGLRPNAYAQNIIDTAHLLPGERELWKHIFGELAERPSRRLTESEIERAFLGGIIDMTRAQDFWKGLGYDDEAIQVHTLLLLQKQSGSNRTRAGSTPHKHLTEAQLEKAYNNGILNLAQLAAGWAHLGYTPDDVQVLSALVQLKTAGPGETLFPTMTTP